MISGSGDPITYNCDGITTEFPITADLGLSDDTAVQVFHTDSAGIETKWSKGTEYSVVAGNVVTAAIYPATDKITIAPELNDQQLLDLIDGDPLDPDNLEGSLDKLAARIREIATHVLRALRLPLTSDAVDSLGTPTVRKGGFPHFNDTTGDLEVVNVIGEGEIISTAMRPVVEAATLGAARTAMDVAEADAGVPTGGTDEQSLVKDGATALATKWKSLKTTETVSTATATIAAPNRDHTVFSDTATLIGAIALTITDATNENARLTIVNLGAFDTTLTMTGLTGETVPGGEARAYVWNGTGYTLASGGGGGGGTDLAEIQVPQPKTWVDKGITPGVSITNQWGLGSFVLECEISGIGAGIYTSRIEVEDLAVSAFSNFFTSNGSNNADAKVIYNGSSGAFELTATVSSVAVAINRIQFYEDDPDNLPLQTIPSDPSLIKDWVEVWNTGTPTAVVTNVWGLGKYMLQLSSAIPSSAEHQTLVIELEDLTKSVYGPFSGTASGDAYFGFEQSTNSFQALQGGAALRIDSIKRWEDVAGADAQMSVPVDGWELIFTDDDNAAPITNIWGEGYYKCVCSISTDVSDAHTSVMQLDSVDENQYGSTANWLAGVRLAYLTSPNEFDITDATYHIKRLYKFNSLVNVLHSYVPDPRSVAQKDWVKVYEDYSNTANITNVWGDGKYKVLVGRASNDFVITCDVVVDRSANTPTGSFRSPEALSSSYWHAQYSPSLNQFVPAGTGVEIYAIYKWQDSQASDAPRTVLDDGYETIWEDQAHASINKTLAVGNGDYVVDFKQGTTSYSARFQVDNSQILIAGVYDPTAKGTYTVATGVWSGIVAGIYPVRIRKYTGKLRIDSQVITNTSEGSNITNAVIDTDAGDVDCTSYFTDTTQDRVVKLTNDGTNGNHLTNCPNGIEIGDGKTVQFYYNLGWRYEDVCIDEYTGAWAQGTFRIIKTSGGRYDLHIQKTSAGGATSTIVYVTEGMENFTSYDGGAGSGNQSGDLTANNLSSLTQALVYCFDIAGTGLTRTWNHKIEGRWKTGV